VDVIAITDGPKNAHLFVHGSTASDSSSSIGSYYEYTIPKLDRIVNPIGAGDTCGATLLSSYLLGHSISDVFRFGLAAASASCLTSEAALFDINVAKEIANNIVVNKRI